MESCSTQSEGLGRSRDGECARCCVGVVVDGLHVCRREAGEEGSNGHREAGEEGSDSPSGDVIYESCPVKAILSGDCVEVEVVKRGRW